MTSFKRRQHVQSEKAFARSESWTSQLPKRDLPWSAR